MCSQRQSAAKYINNYDFSYRLSGPLGNVHADFTMTSVLGHLTSSVSPREVGFGWDDEDVGC